MAENNSNQRLENVLNITIMCLIKPGLFSWPSIFPVILYSSLKWLFSTSTASYKSIFHVKLRIPLDTNSVNITLTSTLTTSIKRNKIALLFDCQMFHYFCPFMRIYWSPWWWGLIFFADFFWFTLALALYMLLLRITISLHEIYFLWYTDTDRNECNRVSAEM